jgi:hypothetical protein
MVIAAPDVYVQGHGAKEGQVVPRLAAGICNYVPAKCAA